MGDPELFWQGALTAEHIWTTYLNTMEFTFHGKPVPKSVTAFMTARKFFIYVQRNLRIHRCHSTIQNQG